MPRREEIDHEELVEAAEELLLALGRMAGPGLSLNAEAARNRLTAALWEKPGKPPADPADLRPAA